MKANDSVRERICSKCGKRVEKFIEKNRLRCYECSKAYWRHRNSQPRAKAASREYGRKKRSAERSRAMAKAAYHRNPEKAAARRKLTNAVRSGKLKPDPCEVCGEKAEGHHEDYSKPLEVRWLCRTHHLEHHRKTRDKERTTWMAEETPKDFVERIVSSQDPGLYVEEYAMELEQKLHSQRKEAAIEELQTYLDAVENFKRKPGQKIADDFGSAGAAIERAGIKTYLEERIAALESSKDKESDG